MALTDNLVSYWKLDEASGNAADSVGGKTLTNTGVTYSSGLINNAANFGYTADHGNSLKRTDGLGVNLGGDFSISFWVKNITPPNSTFFNRLLDWRSTTGTSRYILFNYSLAGSSKTLLVDFSGNANSYTVDLGTTTQHHFVITCSAAGSYIITMDDNVIMTGTRGSSSSGNNFVLGCAVDGSPFGSASLIDECGVWTKVLSVGEKTELYNSGAGLQYPFTTGSSGSSKFFQLFN